MHTAQESVQAYLCWYEEILNEMIRRMSAAPLSCSISHNFIMQMIPHHAAAIQMSENLLKYSHCEPLRHIAGDIITTQTQGISDMECILPQCSCCRDPASELRCYQRRYRDITRIMFSQMRRAPREPRINTDFMREMIPHHRGAVLMSQNALSFMICPQLEPILESIITTQTRGIRQMERLLSGQCRYM